MEIYYRFNTVLQFKVALHKYTLPTDVLPSCDFNKTFVTVKDLFINVFLAAALCCNVQPKINVNVVLNGSLIITSQLSHSKYCPVSNPFKSMKTI